MKSVIYYSIDEETTPTGWTGLAVARDVTSLFWQIDKHIDPYSVVMYEIDHGCSVSFKVPEDAASEEAPEAFDSDEFNEPEFMGFAIDELDIKTGMGKKKMLIFKGRVSDSNLELVPFLPPVVS